MNKFILIVSVVAFSFALGCLKSEDTAAPKVQETKTEPAKKPVKKTANKDSAETALKDCRTNCNKLKDGARNACLRGCKDVGTVTKKLPKAAPKVKAPSAALKACRKACNNLQAGQRNACLRACK